MLGQQRHCHGELYQYTFSELLCEPSLSSISMVTYVPFLAYSGMNVCVQKYVSVQHDESLLHRSCSIEPDSDRSTALV